MTYMTYIHWLTVLFFIAIFALLIIIIKKERNKKLLVSMVFSAVLVVSFLGGFSIYVLDTYLKKAQIYKLTKKRILANETMVIQGFVKNTGSFKIGTTKLWVKMAHKGVSLSRLKGSDIYNPSNSIFEYLTFSFTDSKKKKIEKKNTLIKEFVIAKDLKPGRSKFFSIRMKYPPHFKRPSFFTKVYAH